MSPKKMTKSTSQDTLITLHEDTIPDYDPERLHHILSSPVVCLDIETKTTYPGYGPEHEFGLSYITDILCISFAWGHDNDHIATLCVHGNQMHSIAFEEFMMNLFTGSRVIVGHNIVFDMRLITKWTGNTHLPEHIYDTQAMARLLTPTLDSGYSLLDTAKMLNLPVPESQKTMKSSRARISDLPIRGVMDYACQDTCLTLQIYYAQQSLINSETLYMLADWEARATHQYCRMASEGITLNLDYTQLRIADLSHMAREISAQLQEAGLTMPGSSKSRVAWLYQKLEIPLPDYEQYSPLFTRGGHARFYHAETHGGYSVKVELSDLASGVDAVEMLIDLEPQYHDQLLPLACYLQVNNMLSTLNSLLDHAHHDGKIHSLISVHTDTGRRASSQPNLQNLKMVNESNDPSGNLSGILTGQDGYTLFELDYSNAENWIAAMIAGDSALARACAAQDFHSAMAEQYFGDLWHSTVATGDKSAIKALRFKGKTITFGTAYGMGAKKLAKSLGITLEEAYSILARKDQAFQKIKQTKEAASLKAEQSGVVNLWTKRPIAVDKHRSYTAWNYLCQGGVAEITKRAMVLISEEFEKLGLKSRVACEIHDSLILEVAHEEWREAISLASEIMQTVVPESMNTRTAPAIQWIAQPDSKENSHKWGLGQYHPDLIEMPDPADPPEPIDIPEVAVPTTTTEIISFPDLNFRYELKNVRKGIQPSQYTPEEKQAMLGLGNALYDTLNKTFHSMIPVMQEDQLIAQQIEVPLETWCRVPGLWLLAWQKSGRFFDLKEKTGYSAEQLISVHQQRSFTLEKLPKRIAWCMQIFASCSPSSSEDVNEMESSYADY